MAYARVVLAALALAGCELLVPDSLPTYSCTTTMDSCPMGMVCNLATEQCVYPGDGAPPPDAMGDNYTVDGNGMDVTQDVPMETSVCRSDGCRCSGATDCDSLICADQLTVTAGIWSAAGSHGFCTQPCCTSMDCQAGFVCYGTAAGGNYCINPSFVSRSTPSATNNTGGTSCSADNQCRSGLCVGNVCQDTCCSTTSTGQCSGSYACRYEMFPGRSTVDQHYTSACMTAGGSGGNGASCSSNSTCKSNWCCGGGACFDQCLAACRNSSQCGSGEYCGYALDTNNDVVTTCSPGAGSKGLGVACTSVSECATYTCDMATTKCTDVCYGDSDCTGVSGWVCRPEIVSVMGGGSFSVLMCGPPL